MTHTLVAINDGVKVVPNGLNEEKMIMNHLDLQLAEGEFVVVLGGNGAGKSTLFNALAGSISLTSGEIKLAGETVTHKKEHERAKYVARVFQDPKMGTAPRMTVAENLMLALKRGSRRRLKRNQLGAKKASFYTLCQQVGNGLENHLDTPAGELSGGQRQGLSLLMATMTEPQLLLLDEHTSALDPKTAKQLMALTSRTIKEKNLTCLMITHRMEDAITYGDRLLVLQNGRVTHDLKGSEKMSLTLPDLMALFDY